MITMVHSKKTNDGRISAESIKLRCTSTRLPKMDLRMKHKRLIYFSYLHYLCRILYSYDQLLDSYDIHKLDKSIGLLNLYYFERFHYCLHRYYQLHIPSCHLLYDNVVFYRFASCSFICFMRSILFPSSVFSKKNYK